ncbi:MAG: response regulator [Deltaproteobacteria bacterium]|nr:response regulator [Deltaproteobacteria bacterium]
MASAKVRVLLVDDRPENLLSLEAILSSPDYELIKANSGADALRYLLISDCAIILLDVQMPGMDGFETADLIKNNPKLKDIPIIFLTALNTDQRYVARGYRAGAVDYISKPIVAEYLQTKVAVFAQLHRARLMVIEQSWQLREHEKREQERRLAELELIALRREQALQRRYRDLVEGIPRAIVWVAEPVSLVLSFASAGAVALIGSTIDATRPDQIGRIVHPDDRAAFEERLRALKGDVAETFDHRLLRADGSTLWLSTTVRLEKKLERSEQQSEAAEIRGLSVDVTESKLVERVFRLLVKVSEKVGSTLDPVEIGQRLSEACVPEIADGCVVTVDADDDGKVPAARSEAWATPELAKLAEELERRPAVFDVSRAPLVVREPALRGELDSLGVDSFLAVPLYIDCVRVGTLAMWSCSPTRPMDEQALLLVAEIARRAGQALQNARLYVRERSAVAHRDEFLSVASHELRTPLTALKMGLQNSLGRLESAQQQATTTTAAVSAERAAGVVHSLVVADRQVDRLQLLVDQLLDVSRIRAGRLELDRGEVDLQSLVKDVVARFQPELERKQVTLIQDLHSVVGDWDRSRLDQVISNLISNAIKYGQGKPVDVALRLDKHQACLMVGDRGIGVSAGDVDRIFDRFERAASAQSFSGLGLGLYIARQIVRAHGGDIRVESNTGEGARFFVDLPVATAPAPAPRHVNA